MARGILYKVKSDSLLSFGCVLILLMFLVASLAPLISPFDFKTQNLPSRLDLPSTEHWFGTDELGRDIFSRVVYGTRISMAVGLSVVLCSSTLGLLVGSLAGYYGRWLDDLIMRVVDVLMAFPGILLAIALVAFWGPGLEKLIFALVAVGWVGYARLVRGQ